MEQNVAWKRARTRDRVWLRQDRRVFTLSAEERWLRQPTILTPQSTCEYLGKLCHYTTMGTSIQNTIVATCVGVMEEVARYRVRHLKYRINGPTLLTIR